MNDRPQDDFKELLAVEVETPAGVNVSAERYILAMADITRTWFTNSRSNEQAIGDLPTRAFIALTTMVERMKAATQRPLTNNDRLQEIFDDGIAAFSIVRDAYREMGTNVGNMRISQNVNLNTNILEGLIESLRQKHFPKRQSFRD